MKTNKKIIVFSIILAIILAITGRIFISYTSKSTPKSVTKNYFETLKSGDIAKSKQYLDNTDTTTSYIENAQNQDYFNIYIKSFNIQTINYEIDKQDKNIASVKILVDKIDMQLIFEQYISEIYSTLFTNTTKTDEEIEKDSNAFFLEQINKPDIKKIQKEYNLNLIKINNDWKVVNDDALSKAILDVESLNNSTDSIDSNTSNPTK
jgi:hypothetical protein